MDLSTLSPVTLRELAKLAEQKLSLLKQISEIDSKINAVAKGGTPVKVKPAASAKKASAKKSSAPKSKTGRRGQLKNQIIALLSKAGDAGLSVKEISKTLGVKNQNIHVWFSSTGRKVPGITKLEGPQYALLSNPVSFAPAAPAAPAYEPSAEHPVA